MPARFTLEVWILLCINYPLFAGQTAQKPLETAPLKIVHGWEFYWGDLPGYSVSNSLFDPTPEVSGWKPLVLDGNPPWGERQTVIWYRLTLPAGVWKHPSLYFDTEIATGSTFYIDGKPFYTSPLTYTGSWHIVPLPENFAGKTVYIRVQSYRIFVGIYGWVWIGSEGTFWASVVNSDIVKFSLAIVSIALGIFAGILQLIFRKREGFSYAAFGAFAVCAGYYIFSKSDLRMQVVMDQGVWSYIELLTLNLIPPTITLAFYYTFISKNNIFVLRLAQVLFVAAAAFVGLDLAGIIPLIHLLLTVQVMIMIGGVYLIALAVRYMIDGDVDARIYAAGFGFMILFGIYNVLSALEILPGNKSTVHYGMFFFLLSFVVIFIRRFLSINQKISAYNSELEKQVTSRTAELNDLNRTLLTHTESILREIQMAKRVQEHILPDLQRMPKRPELGFGSRYEAMESVGGDLYDVIRVGKNGYGFLIADVSGHGVAAALITAMVKVDFNTHSRWGVSPSDTIHDVNKDLYEFIGDLEYFLTAYYCILNLETEEFQYSSAGHHPAILLRRSTGESFVLNTPGTIIGSFEDFEWKTESMKLVAGDRILLYTDGIVEARNEAKKLWGYDSLMASAKRHAKLEITLFVDAISEDISRFCGKQPRDDDRALLCVDYIPHEDPAIVMKKS
ncbi:MAG: hypothetical protein A2Y33_06010 [Spirochaetes bacterium GWF1_51_8]|nr:MAG: hypothetical protein A2Y33_06010 [Spirochaetes bacterium GWF1_51_8]